MGRRTRRLRAVVQQLLRCEHSKDAALSGLRTKLNSSEAESRAMHRELVALREQASRQAHLLSIYQSRLGPRVSDHYREDLRVHRYSFDVSDQLIVALRYRHSEMMELVWDQMKQGVTEMMK